MKIKHLLILLLVSPLISFSQQPKVDKNVIDAYAIQLDLKEKQQKQFESILNAYHVKLKDESINANSFNKILKLRALEIYKILDQTQFELYNKIKLKIEPKLKYKFE